MNGRPAGLYAFILEKRGFIHYYITMGYVFDFKDAVSYDQLAAAGADYPANRLQRQLMVEMVKPLFGDHLVDIGCGAGHSLAPFMGKGISLTGVDPSPYMLDFARRNLGTRVDLHRAFAENLPFDDNAFDYAVLSLSLEFVKDPAKAVAEACRVAKDSVFVGIVNKYGMRSVYYRISGIFRYSVYNHARFFSVGEVRRLFYRFLGNVPMMWETVCRIPGERYPLIQRIADARISRKFPLGDFAGILAQPVPRFRTTPLFLKQPAARSGPSGSQVASCAKEINPSKGTGWPHEKVVN